jgi:hypothetical protein
MQKSCNKDKQEFATTDLIEGASTIFAGEKLLRVENKSGSPKLVFIFQSSQAIEKIRMSLLSDDFRVPVRQFITILRNLKAYV